MRSIFIDKDYRCYTAPATGRKEVLTDMFNGKCAELIEGYRYIPAGEVWVREDSVEFGGEAAFPAVDYSQLTSAQSNEEQAALALLGAVGVNAPLTNAAEIRSAMNSAGNTLPDTTAFECAALFPLWDSGGKAVEAGWRCRHEGKLYKVLQSHTTQAAWAPGVAVALFTEIADPAEEWPLIPNPIPAVNPFMQGQKGQTGGGRYTSLINYNTYQPSEYPEGWQKHT